MSYRIAYGLDTETLEDPDQLVLIDLPDDYADLDSEELVRHIQEHCGAPDFQQVVGLQDVLDRLEILIGIAGGIHPSNVQRVTYEVTNGLTAFFTP